MPKIKRIFLFVLLEQKSIFKNCLMTNQPKSRCIGNVIHLN